MFRCRKVESLSSLCGYLRAECMKFTEEDDHAYSTLEYALYQSLKGMETVLSQIEQVKQRKQANKPQTNFTKLNGQFLTQTVYILFTKVTSVLIFSSNQANLAKPLVSRIIINSFALLSLISKACPGNYFFLIILIPFVCSLIFDITFNIEFRCDDIVLSTVPN